MGRLNDKHNCTRQDVEWQSGRYEQGTTRNARRSTRVDYLHGKCRICERVHVAYADGSADLKSLLDIRRHAAFWFGGKGYPTVSVRMWKQ
jgi:hypothetical protein